MSLTSYQAAPPRVLSCDYAASRGERNCKNVHGDLLSPRKGIESRRDEFEDEIENSRRHGELVGSGFCRALVSEENAGGRSAGLVRAAFRNGRGELELLFGAGRAPGGTLVPQHPG